MVEIGRRYRNTFFQNVERKDSPFFVSQRAQTREVIRFGDKSMGFGVLQ